MIKFKLGPIQIAARSATGNKHLDQAMEDSLHITIAALCASLATGDIKFCINDIRRIGMKYAKKMAEEIVAASKAAGDLEDPKNVPTLTTDNPCPAWVAGHRRADGACISCGKIHIAGLA